MKQVFKIIGFVLQKKNLLKNDYLISFFTKKKGKILVFAKGIKKITSRRLSHLQTGNLIEAIIQQKNEVFYLKETNLISGFLTIKNNPKTEKAFYYFLYLIERLVPEQQKNQSLYQLLIKNVFLLTKIKEDKIDNFKKMFTKKVLLDLGYIDNNYNQEEIYQKVEEIINEKIPSYII